MPDRGWMARRARDPYLQRAHRENYRSRAAFKLLEIQEKHQILRPGARVVDLGCAPGSWSQVAAALVGANGRVIGLDLLPTDPIPGVELWQADFLAPTTRARLREAFPGGCDVVLSDMAPHTTGVHHADSGNSCELVGLALDLCTEFLAPGGHFVAKVFEGPEYKGLLDRARRAFTHARSFAPAASLKHSREIFLVAREFRRGG